MGPFVDDEDFQRMLRRLTKLYITSYLDCTLLLAHPLLVPNLTVLKLVSASVQSYSVLASALGELGQQLEELVLDTINITEEPFGGRFATPQGVTEDEVVPNSAGVYGTSIVDVVRIILERLTSLKTLVIKQEKLPPEQLQEIAALPCEVTRVVTMDTNLPLRFLVNNCCHTLRKLSFRHAAVNQVDFSRFHCLTKIELVDCDLYDSLFASGIASFVRKNPFIVTLQLLGQSKGPLADLLYALEDSPSYATMRNLRLRGTLPLPGEYPSVHQVLRRFYMLRRLSLGHWGKQADIPSWKSFGNVIPHRCELELIWLH